MAPSISLWGRRAVSWWRRVTQPRTTTAAEIDADRERPWLEEEMRAYTAGVLRRYTPLTDNQTGETVEMRIAYRAAIAEPAVKAALLGKIGNVAFLDVQVTPEDKNNPVEVEAAAFVKHQLLGPSGTAFELVWAILSGGLVDGFSVCEKLWGIVERGRYKGRWTLTGLKAKDTRYLQLEIDPYRNVTGIVSTYANSGVVFDPKDFVVFSYLPFFSNPTGHSDLRASYRAVQMIVNALKLRLLFLNSYEGPFIKGTCADPARRAAFASVLSRARAQGWIMCNPGEDVEVLDLASRGTTDFQSAVDDLRKEIAISIKGEFLTMLEGSNGDVRGDSEVQKSTSEIFVELLVAFVTGCINAQIVPDLIGPNFGTDIAYPHVSLSAVNPGEVAKELAIDQILDQLGFPLSLAEIADKTGRTIARDPSDRLQKPQAVPTGMPGMGGPGGVPPGGGGDPGGGGRPAPAGPKPPNVLGNPFKPDSGAATFADSYDPNEPRDASGQWTATGAAHAKKFNAAIDSAHKQARAGEEGHKELADKAHDVIRARLKKNASEHWEDVKEKIRAAADHPATADVLIGRIREQVKEDWDRVDEALGERHAHPATDADRETREAGRAEVEAAVARLHDTIAAGEKYAASYGQGVSRNRELTDAGRVAAKLAEGKKVPAAKLAELQSPGRWARLVQGKDGWEVHTPADDADGVHFRPLPDGGLQLTDDATGKPISGGEVWERRKAKKPDETPDLHTFSDRRATFPKGGPAASGGGFPGGDVARFSDSGLDPSPAATSGDVALAGPDGAKIERLLSEAQRLGTDALHEQTRSAIDRMLRKHSLRTASRMWSPAERAAVADALTSALAVAELLGRARVLHLARRNDVAGTSGASGVAQFADRADDFPTEGAGTLPKEFTDLFASEASLLPLPPQEALDYFRGLIPELGLNPGRFAESVRRRAFTMAAATEETILRRVQDVVAEEIAGGAAPVAAMAPQRIDDLLDAAGVSPANPQYAEMVWRTNAMDAYTTGIQDELAADPDVQAAFPVWQYLGIRDGREGDDHRPHFDRYYPNTASFADVRGPRVFNCRCVPNPIHADEWAELQAAGARVESSWGHDAATFADNFDPNEPRASDGKWTAGGGSAGARTPDVGADDTHVSAPARGKLRRLLAATASVPAAIANKVTSFVKRKYADLESKYGRTGARLILAGMIALSPTPIPGSSFIPIALAKAVKRVGRALGKGKGGAAPVVAADVSAHADRAGADPLDADALAVEIADALNDLYADAGEPAPEIDWDKLAKVAEQLLSEGGEA